MRSHSHVRRALLVVAVAAVVIAGVGAALILQEGPSSSDDCFAYTAPARPLRSTDVVILDNDKEVRLTNDHVSQDPSFNADATRIVFSSGRDGEYDPELGFARLALVTESATGGSEERLTDGPYDHQPNWSPIDSEVVFVRSRFGQGQNPQVDFPLREELWTIDVDTQQETRLFRAPPRRGDPYQLYSPVWSPDGRYVAFSRADHKHHDVWIIDRDGSNARRLADDVSGSYFDSPSLDWSPTSDELVFVGETGDGEGIHVLDVNTGRTHRVAERGSVPVWSRDGSQIAYWEGSVKEPDTDYRLFVINRDGDGKQVVEGAPILAYLYGRLDWAPCD